MPLCLESTVNGLQPINPQPTDYTACTYVLQSGNEINAWPPLTISEGVTISLAIGVCWAAAFAFRVLGQFLKQNSNEE